MAKNTSILLGDYFDEFIKKQVKSNTLQITQSQERVMTKFERDISAQK